MRRTSRRRSRTVVRVPYISATLSNSSRPQGWLRCQLHALQHHSFGHSFVHLANHWLKDDYFTYVPLSLRTWPRRLRVMLQDLWDLNVGSVGVVSHAQQSQNRSVRSIVSNDLPDLELCRNLPLLRVTRLPNLRDPSPLCASHIPRQGAYAYVHTNANFINRR